MSEVIRYLASYTPYEGLDLNGKCARHDGDYFVTADDFDRITAERDAALGLLDDPAGNFNKYMQCLRKNEELEGLLARAYETAAKWVEKRSDDYVNEHGSNDPETGSIELPGTGEEYVCELLDIADGLRALKPAEGGGDEA